MCGGTGLTGPHTPILPPEGGLLWVSPPHAQCVPTEFCPLHGRTGRRRKLTAAVRGFLPGLPPPLPAGCYLLRWSPFAGSPAFLAVICRGEGLLRWAHFIVAGPGTGMGGCFINVNSQTLQTIL